MRTLRVVRLHMSLEFDTNVLIPNLVLIRVGIFTDNL